jgi:mRNA degradation ribonuclease J1/J2
MPSKKRSGTRASRRRPKVVFFLDRCTNSRRLVAALSARGVVVEVHWDHFAHDIPDAEWLSVVGEKRWVVLTHDKRIRYRPIERDALVAA